MTEYLKDYIKQQIESSKHIELLESISDNLIEFYSGKTYKELNNKGKVR